MNRRSVKDEAFTAYNQGKSLKDNPYPASAMAHLLWKQEFIFSATDPDFEPFPEDRNLNYYICNAMANQGVLSERELSKTLGKAHNFVNNLLVGKALPSDEVMMKIADLAGLDKQAALLDLNVWRSPTPVRDAYVGILQKLTQTTAAIAILAASSLTLAPSPVSAKVLSDKSDTIYYGKHSVFF